MAEVAEEAKSPALAPGLPMKMVIMIAVGMLLLGLGGAALLFHFIKGAGPSAKNEEQASEAPAPAKEGHDTGSKPQTGATAQVGVIYDLDPFIVNLADTPEIHYLKVTVKFELERPDVTEELNKRLPQTRDAILVLLSSKEAAAVRSAQGKLQLREEILQRVNALLPKGGARGVYFTDFIVQ
ncbi:MAG TPA: flagellar basal body-associated FliL family protein [Nitrospiraceae bacterium]|nr:flagellar basal body-associated FliL family protein [Nitrospiraceae bacterium]